MADRSLAATAAQDDGGAVDPVLAAALAGWRADGDPAAVHRALAGARLFVAVEARLVAAVPVTGADKEADLVLVTVGLPDGGTGLPAFSGLAALAAWRPSARPVAVSGRELCAEVVRLGHRALVLDPGDRPALTVDATDLAALAAGWSPVDGLAGAAARAAEIQVRPATTPLPARRRRALGRALRPVAELAEVYEIDLTEGTGWRPALGVAPRAGVPGGAVGRVAAALGTALPADSELELVVLKAAQVAALTGAVGLSRPALTGAAGLSRRAGRRR